MFLQCLCCGSASHTRHPHCAHPTPQPSASPPTWPQQHARPLISAPHQIQLGTHHVACGTSRPHCQPHLASPRCHDRCCSIASSITSQALQENDHGRAKRGDDAKPGHATSERSVALATSTTFGGGKQHHSPFTTHVVLALTENMPAQCDGPPVPLAQLVLARNLLTRT
jgi:hypothetical protein